MMSLKHAATGWRVPFSKALAKAHFFVRGSSICGCWQELTIHKVRRMSLRQEDGDDWCQLCWDIRFKQIQNGPRLGMRVEPEHVKFIPPDV